MDPLGIDDKIKTDGVEVTKSYVINRFEYKVLNLSLNESVELHISLFSDTTFIKVSMLIIEGELYDSWGENDEYIVDIIKRNIRKLAECSSSVIAE